MTYQIGEDTVVRPEFITTGALNNTVDSQFRAISDMWPVFAFAHDLGTISATKSTPIVYAIGHVRDPLVHLLKTPNINGIHGAYYHTGYSSISNMVCSICTSFVSRVHVTLLRSLRFSMITQMLWHER